MALGQNSRLGLGILGRRPAERGSWNLEGNKHTEHEGDVRFPLNTDGCRPSIHLKANLRNGWVMSILIAMLSWAGRFLQPALTKLHVEILQELLLNATGGV